MIEFLTEKDTKILERYLELYCYGKSLRSSREFVDIAIELMEEKVFSEDARRKEIDDYEQINFNISKNPSLYSLIRERLAGDQHRELTELIKSLKRELPENQYFYLRPGIEALLSKNGLDRERHLRRQGIKYSSVGRGLCSLISD